MNIKETATEIWLLCIVGVVTLWERIFPVKSQDGTWSDSKGWEGTASFPGAKQFPQEPLKQIKADYEPFLVAPEPPPRKKINKRRAPKKST